MNELIIVNPKCVIKDYMCTLTLQKIACSIYKFKTLAKRETSVALFSLIKPFVDKELDRSEKDIDVSYLNSLITNSYKYPNCVWNGHMHNSAAALYIYESLQGSKFFEGEIDFPELYRDYQDKRFELKQDESKRNEKDGYVFQKTISDLNLRISLENSVLSKLILQCAILESKKQEPFHKLVKPNLVNSIATFVQRNSMETDLHFSEIVIRLYRCLKRFDDTEVMNKALNVMYNIKEYDTLDKLSYILEILKLIDTLMQNQLLTNFSTNYIFTEKLLKKYCNILNYFCNFKLLANPNGLRFYEDAAVVSKKTIKLHQAMLNQDYYEKDVILEAYQRDVAFMIFRTMNRLLDCKVMRIATRSEQQIVPLVSAMAAFNGADAPTKKHFLYIGKSPFIKSLRDNTDFLSSTLQNAVIKYSDHENEEELSYMIMASILKIDYIIGNRSYAPSIAREQNYLEEADLYELSNFSAQINDMCLNVLQFLCPNESASEESTGYIQELENLLEKVSTRIESILHEFLDQNDRPTEVQMIFVKNHSIFQLVELLSKAYQFVDFENSKAKNFTKEFNSFICEVYKFLKVVLHYNAIASQCLWGYDGHFFTIRWKNKNANALHQEVVLLIMEQIGVYVYRYDSIKLFNKIFESIGQYFPNEVKGKMIRKENTDSYASKYELPRNLTTNFEETTFYLIKHYANKRIVESDEDSKECDPNESQAGMLKRHESHYAMGHAKLMESLSRKVTRCLDQNGILTNYMINPCYATKSSCFVNMLAHNIEYSSGYDDKEMKVKLLLNFIHRTIKYLSQCDVDITNQHHYVHLLQILLCITEKEEVINIYYVKAMYYSDDAVSTFLNVIIKDFNFIHSSTQVKSICYLLLTKAIHLDKEETRKSINRWFSNQKNTINFFSKFYNMVKMVSMTLLSDHISDQYDINYELTDLDELEYCLEFLTVICVDDMKWQDYLRTQDNCVLNYNMIPAITDLLRITKSKFQYVYAVDLAICLLDFINASVNGHVEQNENCYVSSRIFDSIEDILQIGYYDKFETYRDLECREIENKTHGKIELVIKDNKKLNDLKVKSLTVVQSLLNEKTKHQFTKSKNYDILMKIIKLGYIQFVVAKNKKFTSDMFYEKAKICNDFSIRVPFMSYYLIAKLWNDDLMNESNIVQLIDKANFVSRYIRWIVNIFFMLCWCKDKSPLINERQYQIFNNNKKLKENSLSFFEAHSSHIEVVMQDGHTETRFFEILPAFTSFSQQEKNQFWYEANLDTSKSTIKSFLNYSSDKIDEIFIQQQVQDIPIVFIDCAKKNNWLTDSTQTLIVALNLLIFFGYEANVDDSTRFDHPTIFGLSSGATIAMMYTIGGILCGALTYITLIQFVIMLMLQSERAKAHRERKGKRISKHQYKAFCQICYYIFSNFNETVSTRDMWCLVPVTICAWLGISVNMFWFSFTPLFLMIFFPQILEITSAVWQPRRRIFYTIVLSTIILYWFALVAYSEFYTDFSNAAKNSSHSIARVFVVIFDVWHKSGGIGAYLDDEDGESAISDIHGNYRSDNGRIIFDFLFFFVVPTLLLSILSGIIIDNFVERRSQVDQIQNRQNDLCFVCGTASNEISDFEYHCKYLHNIWDYMYYMGYLRSKKPSEILDHRDVHVIKQMAKGSMEWFPCFQELVEERHKNKTAENEKINLSYSAGSSLEHKIKKMNKETVAKVQNMVNDVENKVNLMQRQMNSKFQDVSKKLTDIANAVSKSPRKSKAR